MGKWDFIHARGCGKVAFTYSGETGPKITDRYADTILQCTYPNGEPVQIMQPRRCGSCGGGLSHEDLRIEFFQKREEV